MAGNPDSFDYTPSLDDWIIVPGWSKFQHYKNRSPLWIKVYSKLLHDPKYLQLSLASRGLLLVIWLAYSQENGSISVRNVNKLSQNRVSLPQLMSLNQAGFIRFAASKPLEPNREVEIEKETPLTPLTKKDLERQLHDRALNIVADWQGQLSSDEFATKIQEIEDELHVRLGTAQREALWDEALRRERTNNKPST